LNRLIGFTFLIPLLLLACEQQTSTSVASTEKTKSSWLSPTGPVPAFTQRAGDASKGQEALLNMPYVNCGIPERVYRELLRSAQSEDVVSLPARNSSMEGLPYFTNRVMGRTGTPVVSNNCLTCHATPLFGEVVIGLGNEFANFTANPSEIVERAGLLVTGEAETTEWELYADRIAAIAPYVQMQTVGVNPANNLTFALIAHRDPETHAWLAEPQLPLPTTNPPPVSVPPWWRMKKKHALFNLSEGRNDHARMMLAASMLCADSVSELNEIDRYAPDVRAYLSSLSPPDYPFEIDRALATEGEALFGKICADCHGTYGSEPSYPNLVIPIDVIGTDRRLMDLATGESGKQYSSWFNESWFGELSLAAPALGYVAPPLDGIWATAPYLHNGSVPNVRVLLNSTERPSHWQHYANHARDKANYDTKNLGWNHETSATGSGDPGGIRLYDTTRPGYSNARHTFGDLLSEGERSAILEFLKTL